MDSNDVNARLAALQARRPQRPGTGPATLPATTARTNPVTGRSRKHHPARRARIVTTAMSVLAMFGITGYMAAHDAAAASTAATVTAAQTSTAQNATSPTATTQTVTAATAATATTHAATVTKGS